MYVSVTYIYTSIATHIVCSHPVYGGVYLSLLLLQSLVSRLGVGLGLNLLLLYLLHLLEQLANVLHPQHCLAHKLTLLLVL